MNGIQQDMKTIKVEVLNQLLRPDGSDGDTVPSGIDTFCYEDGNFRAELVPYFNGVSKERDPMVRQISHHYRFLHLSTIKKMYPRIIFKTEDGGQFGISEVINNLYGNE